VRGEHVSAVTLACGVSDCQVVHGSKSFFK